MALKYKVGDKVILTNGDTMTVYQINDTLKWYFMREDPLNCYTDEMIEGLVEEEVLLNIDDFQDDNEIIDIIDEYVHRLKDNECQINLPEGYQFKDENGNVINATKIVLEKKKKEYPKTYEECCLINGAEDKIPLRIIGEFTRLINARNAYWKLYGEENGLGKPWEPDWKDDTTHKFIIHTIKDKIHCGVSLVKNHLLAFPTAEMRNAFYENFKKEIEICKELL